MQGMSIFHRRILRYQLADAFLYWGLIPGAILVAGTLIDLAFSLPVLPGRMIRWGGAVFPLVAGLLLIGRATRDLADRGLGTPNPHQPPRRLVREGVYRLCRHPMFLGYDLCALAVLLVLGSPGMLVVCFPVFLILQGLFLHKEERYLERRFPQYPDYQREVPFLLPRAWPSGGKGRAV